MSFRPIEKIESQALVETVDSWVKKYKEQFIEHYHDTSQLTLLHPDDCILVAGPPRRSHASSADSYHVIGFTNAIQYTQARQVQPVKAIGSRRHIFSVTNTPVQGTIQRMMLLGRNLLRSLYDNARFGSDITNRNSKFVVGNEGDDAAWWTNLEEDVYRVPFGLGVIYNAPANVAGDLEYVAGADYLEVCTITNWQTSIQSGQTMMAESISFYADRVIPWDGYTSLPISSAKEAVRHSSDMA